LIHPFGLALFTRVQSSHLEVFVHILDRICNHKSPFAGSDRTLGRRTYPEGTLGYTDMKHRKIVLPLRIYNPYLSKQPYSYSQTSEPSFTSLVLIQTLPFEVTEYCRECYRKRKSMSLPRLPKVE
jgi:hypothetical protein